MAVFLLKPVSCLKPREDSAMGSALHQDGLQNTELALLTAAEVIRNKESLRTLYRLEQAAGTW